MKCLNRYSTVFFCWTLLLFFGGNMQGQTNDTLSISAVKLDENRLDTPLEEKLDLAVDSLKKVLDSLLSSVNIKSEFQNTKNKDKYLRIRLKRLRDSIKMVNLFFDEREIPPDSIQISIDSIASISDIQQDSIEWVDARIFDLQKRARQKKESLSIFSEMRDSLKSTIDSVGGMDSVTLKNWLTFIQAALRSYSKDTTQPVTSILNTAPIDTALLYIRKVRHKLTFSHVKKMFPQESARLDTLQRFCNSILKAKKLLGEPYNAEAINHVLQDMSSYSAKFQVQTVIEHWERKLRNYCKYRNDVALHIQDIIYGLPPAKNFQEMKARIENEGYFYLSEILSTDYTEGDANPLGDKMDCDDR